MNNATYTTQNQKLAGARKDKGAPQNTRKSDSGIKSMNQLHRDFTNSEQNARKRDTFEIKACRSDLILFTSQLSVMLDSGVVLSDALDAIAGQFENSVFKSVTEDIGEKIKAGKNFSGALSDYPKIFSPMFISMVKASESSGKMPEMLLVLSDYLDFEADTRKQIKGALTYPAIMTVMALIATGILMVFVLPMFMEIYHSKGAALPKITQLLVGFSKMTRDFETLTLTLTTLIGLTGTIYYWANSTRGRRFIDLVKIRIPIIGTMFTDNIVTQSMRIMSTMTSAGVNVMDTIRVMKGSCGNYHFQRLWRQVAGKVKDGYQLSEAIQASQQKQRLIAPGIIAMLRAGEESGEVAVVSNKVANFYEKKLHASIKSATALIEPMMIIILGGIIGVIAIALLLPVFRISTVIAN